MALTHKYTLLCDEIRQENNGKFLIIGLYTPDMTVGAIPFVVPALSFFVCMESDAGGTVDINFRLTHGNNIIGGGSARMGIARAGMVVLPLRLGPLQLPGAGTYTFTIEVSGQSEPFSTNFDVTLVAQGQPGMPPGPGIVH